MKHPHLAYARDVVSGKQVANRLVTAQCQRSLALHENPPDGRRFIGTAAAKHIDFARRVKHHKGRWAGMPFEPEPWQEFAIGELFGWYYQNAVGLPARWYQLFVLECGRKNGKTFLGSILCAEELAHGYEGAEIYSAATKLEQAQIVWDGTNRMLRRTPDLVRGYVRTTKQIKAAGDRIFAPMSSRSKTLDGHNPSLCIIDEAAAIDDPVLFEVLETAMISSAGLMLYLTTAQYRGDTPYNARRGDVAGNLLLGGLNDHHEFALLYGLDEGDDWQDERTWIKANPNLHTSLDLDKIRATVAKAQRLPSTIPGMLVKHFCVWADATTTWLPSHRWAQCKVDDWQRQGRAHVGIDLAKKRDLCAITVIWVRADGGWWMESKAWTPRETFDELPEQNRRVYQQAEDDGELMIVDEPIVPMQALLDYVHEINDSCEGNAIEVVGIDPAYATEIEAEMEDYGLPVLRVGQGKVRLSQPTRAFEAAVFDRKIRHGGGAFFAWQLRNVEVWHDIRDNPALQKPKSKPLAKIDNPIAAVIATATIGQDVEGKMPMQLYTIEKDASGNRRAVSVVDQTNGV